MCDKRMYHLMCYISPTLAVKQYVWVGDNPNVLLLAWYADADFPGCRWTLRSTSGYVMAVSGPPTTFPLSAVKEAVERCP